MLKRFLEDSLIYTVPAVISRGLPVLLVPLYTRVLSPADYGALDMLLVFGSIVNLTVALEVSQGVARYYADEDDGEVKSDYASTALWFTLLCYTLFLVFVLSCTTFLSPVIMGASGLDQVFRLGMVYLWLNGLFYLVHNQFRWEFRSVGYAVVGLLVSFITAGVAVVLAYGLKWGLQGLLYGMIAGSGIGCACGLWGLRATFRLRFQWQRLKEMLLFSAPLVPSGIAVFVSLYIDRFMINYYLSLDEVGLYGVGFRIASMTGLVMVGFQGALTPLIYAHYREEGTPRSLALIFRVFMACALVLVIGMGSFAEDILRVMTTPAYYEAATVVLLLVPAILLSNMYMFAPGISIAKKTHIILWINIAGALLMVFFNWLLIPAFGIQGAAVAKVAGYLGIFVFYMIASQRFYHVPHRWAPLLVSVVFAAVLTAWGVTMDFGGVADRICKTALIVLAWLFFMAAGLVRWNEMKKVILWAGRWLGR